MGFVSFSFFKNLFIADWFIFGEKELNITLWTIVFWIIFWIVFLVISYIAALLIFGVNLEDYEKETGKKPNIFIQWYPFIIAIVFTCICAFFWFNVFN